MLFFLSLSFYLSHSLYLFFHSRHQRYVSIEIHKIEFAFDRTQDISYRRRGGGGDDGSRRMKPNRSSSWHTYGILWPHHQQMRWRARNQVYSTIKRANVPFNDVG